MSKHMLPSPAAPAGGRPGTEAVEVPCLVLERAAETLRILVNGRERLIPRAAIARESAGAIAMPRYLARALKLRTIESCYSVEDIVARLGFRREWYPRNRAKLEAEGFPPPLLSFGPPRFDPPSVEAWFARHHPDRPAVTIVANDPLPADSLEADADVAARLRLGSVYGGGLRS